MNKLLTTGLITLLSLSSNYAFSAKIDAVEALNIAQNVKPGNYYSVEYIHDKDMEAYLITGLNNKQPIDLMLDANSGEVLDNTLIDIEMADTDLHRAMEAALARQPGEILSIVFIDEEQPFYLAVVKAKDKLASLEISAATYEITRLESCEGCGEDELSLKQGYLVSDMLSCD